MRRTLVVANRTLGGDHLVAELRRRMAEGPCTFHVVVPASHPSHMWSEGEVNAVAQARLDEALHRFRELGAEVSGSIGDASPVLAITDACRDAEFDDVILSTLPPGVSRWLHQDVAHRVTRHTGLPVTHVIAERETATV